MPPAPSLSTYLRNGLFGGIVAGLLNLLLLLLARLLQIAIDLPVGPNATTTAPLTWWAVVGVSVAAGLVAALLLWALSWLTEHGWGYFALLAALVLVLSFIPVLVLGSGVAPRAMLGAMHVIAAAAIVGAMARVAR